MMLQDLSFAFGLVFWWTVPFLLVLGVVVIVHELGHFWAARALGVTVETFSIGFGPEIAGFYDRKGTRWRIAWVPLGGYVKFKGDESIASMPSAEQLQTLTPKEREGKLSYIVLVAADAYRACRAFRKFRPGSSDFRRHGAGDGHRHTGSADHLRRAWHAGGQGRLRSWRSILSVGGNPVKSFEDFSIFVKLNARSPIDIGVDRGGKRLNLVAVPELTEGECVGRLGVVGASKKDQSQVVSAGIFDAASIGLQKTWRIVEGPFQFFDQLFRGNACASSLGGPVKIAEVAKTYATEGFVNLVPLIAFISVSVGLFNLFPIPVLDGGHLLFYGAEAILGRPLNQRAQEIGFQFGFILLLMLMVFVTWNNIADISRGQPQAPKTPAVCTR